MKKYLLLAEWHCKSRKDTAMQIHYFSVDFDQYREGDKGSILLKQRSAQKQQH